MPFRLFALPSYGRCFKKLGNREQHVAGLIIAALSDYFQSDFPIKNKPHIFKLGQRSYRLVFKKLRGQIWEAYIEGQVRILTRLDNDKHFLVFAGNHDQVRFFLKEN